MNNEIIATEAETPYKVCEILKQGASSRTIKALDIIHQVCIEQANRGSSDFTIAMIGRLSKEAYGPGIQAIRNKTGKKYQALIKSWAAYKKPVNVVSDKVKEKDAWVNDINEAHIRWLVLDLIADNRRLRGQLQLAKEQSNIHIDMRSETSKTSSQQHLKTQALLPDEREALSHAIDEQEILAKQWTIGELGEVLDVNGEEVFQIGFVEAIQKILTLYSC
jgi:hypothetical protein